MRYRSTGLIATLGAAMLLVVLSPFGARADHGKREDCRGQETHSRAHGKPARNHQERDRYDNHDSRRNNDRRYDRSYRDSRFDSGWGRNQRNDRYCDRR